MAANDLHSPIATGKMDFPIEDFRARMLKHEVNGCRELSEGCADAAVTIPRHINALCTYIGAAVRERDNFSGVQGGRNERPTDTLNNEIVGGAFDALAYMAALAEFFATEAALGNGMK